MDARDHFRAAERLLDEAMTRQEDAAIRAEAYRAATVHGLLAVAAALGADCDPAVLPSPHPSRAQWADLTADDDPTCDEAVDDLIAQGLMTEMTTAAAADTATAETPTNP